MEKTSLSAQENKGATISIYIFVGKIGEVNKRPQGMVEINISSTKEVEINIK